LHGSARGYVVCVKPLRFTTLRGNLVTTFAELGGENCYYVFQREEDARRQLERVPQEQLLGLVTSVREVVYLPNVGPADGPRLDPQGLPFAMRGFLVDHSGTISEWRDRGRLGWRDPNTATPFPNETSFVARFLAWARGRPLP
jgi:hypothetical protein